MMIDMHNHILPLVDDGSQSLEYSMEMIKKEILDGVESIILTPHVQSRVSKVSPLEHIKIFNDLNHEVKRLNLPINLFLGSEIFYRSHLTPDYDMLSLAGSKYILLEFSTTLETPIEQIVSDLFEKDYIPIIAHVERYRYLLFEDLRKIKNAGGMLQVNGNSLLGLDPKIDSKQVMKILTEELADFIATDAHTMDVRLPNLRDAYLFLEKYLSKDYLEKIFYGNAKLIIT